jgi:hypothetical protein
MNEYYVYGHYTEDTNELFYVGKGKGSRHKQLSDKRRNLLWQNVAKKHGVKVEILHENLTEEEAFKIEIDLIKEYGRRDLRTGILTNLTDGGEGSSGAKCIGRKLTELEKEHLSKLLRGKKKPLRSTEHCKKISQSKTGVSVGPFSEEHRLKISKSNTGKTFTEEHRKKLSEAKKGKLRGPHSEEHRKKLSEAHKGKTHTDEVKQKIKLSKSKKAKL